MMIPSARKKHSWFRLLKPCSELQAPNWRRSVATGIELSCAIWRRRCDAGIPIGPNHSCLALGRLSPDQYETSDALREWARKNKDQKYVPLDLLEAWGFFVNCEP